MNNQNSISAGEAIEDTKYAAKHTAGAAVVLLAAIYMPMPFGWAASLLHLAGAIAGLTLIVGGTQCLYHGCTAVSASLHGPARIWFQAAVAAAVPILLSVGSLYFVEDTGAVSLQDATGRMQSLDVLAGLAAVAWVSWAAAEQMDRSYPFRGFLTASGALLFVCAGAVWPEVGEALETGRFTIYFLTCVAVSYAGILVRLLKP